MPGPRIAVDLGGLDPAAPRGPARYASRLLDELRGLAGDRVTIAAPGAATEPADVVLALGTRPRVTRTPPVVAAVYDLAHLLAPGTLGPWERARRGFATAWLVRQAAHVLAPSLTIAAALDTYLRVSGDRLTWLPAVGPEWRRSPRADVEAERERLGLRRPYLLFTGTFSRRKNLPTLLAAWDRLRPELGDHLDLVLCGAGDATAAGVPPGSPVRQLGYVSDDRLRHLLSGALAWVSPSRAEGSSIGAVEAMTMGAPPIVAAGTALAEVVGSAGMVVPADDVDGWAAALRHVARDLDDRNRMAARGLVAVRELRTSDAAVRILRAAEAAARGTAERREDR